MQKLIYLAFFTALGGSGTLGGGSRTAANHFCHFHYRFHSPFPQVSCWYLHRFSYNIITCSEGKFKQVLPTHFLTAYFTLKKDGRIYRLGCLQFHMTNLPSSRGGLLSPLQDLASREGDRPALVLPLITPPPIKNIYTCAEMLRPFSPS